MAAATGASLRQRGRFVATLPSSLRRRAGGGGATLHVAYRVDGSLEFSRIEEDDRFEGRNLETLVEQVGRRILHNLILTCCVTLFWLLLRSEKGVLVSVSGCRWTDSKGMGWRGGINLERCEGKMIFDDFLRNKISRIVYRKFFPRVISKRHLELFDARV